MIPIYFPYTYISNPVAEAVAACFGRFAVFQPLADKLPLSMQPWVDKGMIDIRIPVRGDDRVLESAVNNYLNWANLHTGSSAINLASLKTLGGSTPLLNVSLSSQIVTDLKKQINGKLTEKSSDPVLTSRIFLYFAQEFDQQSQQIDHVLEEFHKKEQELIQDLKMEEDALAAEFKKIPDPMPGLNTDYLVAGRLEAWIRILLKDREPSGLFVTHSAAVLEQLLDRAPGARKIIDFETIPRLTATTADLAPWQEKLMTHLSDIVENRWPSASGEKDAGFEIPVTENAVSLRIYLIPDQAPIEFFCHCAGIKSPESDSARPPAGGINTLLGLVEP